MIIITTWNDPGTDVIADTISTIGASTGGANIDKNDGKLLSSKIVILQCFFVGSTHNNPDRIVDYSE